MIYVPTPCKEQVEKYLMKWENLPNYVMQENSLNKLFFELAPYNKCIEDILIKCSTLNDFYSTNIFSIYPIAEHILELNIDNRLDNADSALVHDIAHVNISGHNKYFYSFASKYCSHHRPLDYPIYDNYVVKILKHFKKIDCFSKFTMDDLKNDYSFFKNVLLDFRKFYNIEEYNLKDLDRYLWQLGKEYYPNKY